MPQHKYKGITFAKGWNGTFEQFKAEFENTHVFKAVDPKDKLAEMKRVFNTITKKEPSKEE